MSEENTNVEEIVNATPVETGEVENWRSSLPDELKGDADILSKRKHAKWKATDIVQALKEGRAPTLPPTQAPSTQAPPQVPQFVPASTTFTSTIPAASTAGAAFDVPAARTGGIVSSIGSAISSISNTVGFNTSASASASDKKRSSPRVATDPRVKDAIELSSFAIASMKYGDIAGAKTKLAEALRRLE